MVWIENTGRGRLNLLFGVKLPPGVNEVDSSAWKKCKGEKITKHYLSNQRLRVVAGAVGGVVSLDGGSALPAEPAPVPSPPPPSEPQRMKAKDIIALVQASHSQEALGAMLKTEERTTVVSAIRARLEDLNTAD